MKDMIIAFMEILRESEYEVCTLKFAVNQKDEEILKKDEEINRLKSELQFLAGSQQEPEAPIF